MFARAGIQLQFAESAARVQDLQFVDPPSVFLLQFRLQHAARHLSGGAPVDLRQVQDLPPLVRAAGAVIAAVAVFPVGGAVVGARPPGGQEQRQAEDQAGTSGLHNTGV